MITSTSGSGLRAGEPASAIFRVLQRRSPESAASEDRRQNHRTAEVTAGLA